jgi:hypothetical protein
MPTTLRELVREREKDLMKDLAAVLERHKVPARLTAMTLTESRAGCTEPCRWKNQIVTTEDGRRVTMKVCMCP